MMEEELEKWATCMVEVIVYAMPEMARKDAMVAGAHFGALAQRMQTLAKYPGRFLGLALMSEGPCYGCGEMNHTAHNVSICAACLRKARKASDV